MFIEKLLLLIYIYICICVFVTIIVAPIQPLIHEERIGRDVEGCGRGPVSGNIPRISIQLEGLRKITTNSHIHS